MKLVKRIGVPSLIILLMLLSMYPYIFQLFFGFPKENVMGVVFFGIIFLYCLTIKRRQRGMPNELTAIMIIQSIAWLFYYAMFNDTSYFTRIFFIVLTFLSLSMLLWKDSFFKFLDINNKFLAIQGVLGIIAFVLVFIGVLQPLISIVNENGYGSINFYGLTCSNAVFDNFMRVGGYFDEPGAFAFWGVFALVFNKLTTDNRKLEIVLLISLLFTFSAAYFIVLPIYFICFYSTKLKSTILMLVIFIPIVFIASRTLSSNSVFLHYTVERFSGGQIRSTRYDQTDDTKQVFLQSPVFGQGGRKLELMGGNHFSDNPYEILAKDGIVGFIITYLPLFYVILRYRRKKNVLFSSGILLIDYMQRPFHMNEMHYLMLYLFCSLVILKYGRSNVREHSPLLMGENVSPLQTKHINSQK